MTVFSAPLRGLPAPLTPVGVAMIMDGPPAVALAFDSARLHRMNKHPRRPDAQILSARRVGKLVAFGTTMMVETLAVLWHGLSGRPPEYALTLAFTNFVLFQVFNMFNARAEKGTSFNRKFFDNSFLSLSLGRELINAG